MGKQRSECSSLLGINQDFSERRVCVVKTASESRFRTGRVKKQLPRGKRTWSTNLLRMPASAYGMRITYLRVAKVERDYGKTQK
jgi:hypothetical protein